MHNIKCHGFARYWIGAALLLVGVVHQWSAITMSVPSGWRVLVGLMAFMCGVWLMFQPHGRRAWRFGVAVLSAACGCVAVESRLEGCGCRYVVPPWVEGTVDAGTLCLSLMLFCRGPLTGALGFAAFSAAHIVMPAVTGGILVRAWAVETPRSPSPSSAVEPVGDPVVVDPQRIIGQAFPWFDEIDVFSGRVGDLRAGPCLICVFRGDCGECVEHARHFGEFARVARNSCPSLRIAVFEVPGGTTLWSRGNPPPACEVWGQFHPDKEWFVTAPRFVWLRDGVIERVESELSAGIVAP